MLRKFLTLALPFLLPFLIYGVYLLLRKRAARRGGKPAPPGWAAAPWGLIFVAAAILCAATLVTYRFTVENQWQDPVPPRVTGTPGAPPAGEGIVRPE